MGSLYSLADQIDPVEYGDLVDQWLDLATASEYRTDPEDLSPDELRRQVRTRLVSSLFDGLEPYPYARRPFPLVGQIICIDYPEAIIRVTGQLAAKMALPVDQLFAPGQANTDAEPADSPAPLGDDGTYEITGESDFIASKAANLGALVPSVIGPAPHGLIFAIPRDNAIVYEVVRAGWGKRVNEFAPLAAALATHYAQEDSMVSPASYYWAPDGTVEMLSRPGTDDSGGRTLSITIGPVFSANVMRQVAPQ
ncbi:MAG: hypothetical protein LBK95_09435 [Bifidobacteriaceae bacterium]|nr:hypothetical protein [Bifidobacteriaceae bacterium]